MIDDDNKTIHDVPVVTLVAAFVISLLMWVGIVWIVTRFL